MTKVILTVDDSATVISVLEAALTEVGYEVVSASDGIEGLNKLSELSVDLIISDVNMPNMDGLTFVKEIRQRDDTKFTPIMMLTTERGKAEVQQAKDAGAKAWIVKPFKSEMVVDAVQKILGPSGA